MMIAAAAAMLLTAPAAAEQFTHDGVTYNYSVTPVGAHRLITGKTPNGDRFRLLVKNGRVTGNVAGRPVAFRTREVKPLVQLAQR
jgi:hypothetical protein